MNILPLGSIVTLKKAKRPAKMMIIARNGLFTQNGVTGYLDYVACLYPVGLSSKTFYFNREDIKDIIFVGYIDDKELKYQQLYLEMEFEYPKLIIK